MNLRESIVRQKQMARVPVIAEIKRRIPKLGNKEPDRRDAGILARLYEAGGAAGISVVAEAEHFGGCPEYDIPAVLEATALPVLIKDFILDTATVDYYAKLISSSSSAFLKRVTLLIISHLAGDQAANLIEQVHCYGMLALVETRGLEDLPYISGLRHPPTLIGMNNKVIDMLEMDDNGVRLNSAMVSEYRKLGDHIVLISESAHLSPVDVRKSMEAGADAVLAGTAFMQARDPAVMVAQFVHAGGWNDCPE